LERAIAIRENTLGPEHADTTMSVNNPAVLLRKQGDLERARVLSQRALASFEKEFGSEHALTKNTARVTADALDALGRTEEAKALWERYGPVKPKRVNWLVVSCRH
jgi:hypothetical protein